MNIRLAVHLLVSIAFALALVFGGYALGGPLLALPGFALWFVLEQLVKALLPAPFQPGVEGAQPTSSLYRGWAAGLVASAGLAGSRTPQADAARLKAGVRLCLLSFGLRDGSQTTGHLLLQPSPANGVTLAWRGRGAGQRIQPINPPLAVFPEGRQQQNTVQARLGFTVPLQLGPDSYWLRRHDAELLKLVLRTGTGTEPEIPAETGPASTIR